MATHSEFFYRLRFSSADRENQKARMIRRRRARMANHPPRLRNRPRPLSTLTVERIARGVARYCTRQDIQPSDLIRIK